MNKFLNRKGSATIEAAIVIPIIAISILSVLFLIKIAYIHYSVQMALDSAANEIGHYSYLYEMTGMRDEVSGNKEAANDMETSANSVIEEMYKIKNSFNELNKMKKSETQWQNKEEDIGISELIQRYIEKTSEFADKMIAVKSSAEKMWKAINSVKDMLEDGVSGVLERKFEKLILDKATLKLMARNLDGSVINFIYNDGSGTALQGEDAFDMSLSNYFEPENDYKLEFVVIYKVKNPLPFNLVGDIKLMNRVVVDPWIGDVE